MEELKTSDIISLIKLYNHRFKRDPNLSELSDALGLNSDNSKFVRIRNILEKEKIIKVNEDRGNKIVILDKNKLQEYIPEIPFIKYYEKYFRVKFKRGFEYSDEV